MITIQVCIGSACHLKGSYNVISVLQHLIETERLEQQVELKTAFCLGNCTGAVCVKVNGGETETVESGNVAGFFDKRVRPLLAPAAV